MNRLGRAEREHFLLANAIVLRAEAVYLLPCRIPFRSMNAYVQALSSSAL